MITKKELSEAISNALLIEGKSLEDAIFAVSQTQIQHLPSHLEDDPQAISDIVAAVQYCAREKHPEFESGANLHDITLKRLLPKKKTFDYVQRLENEA